LSNSAPSKIGYWFDNKKEVAQEFMYPYSHDNDTRKFYEVYLKIDNPKVYKMSENNDGYEALRDDLDEFAKWDAWEYVDGKNYKLQDYKRGEHKHGFNMDNAIEAQQNFVNNLKKQGYDGIIVETKFDSLDAHPNLQYIVFAPSQIKSVDNRGTFDENNPDIYYQSAYHGSPYLFDEFSTEHIGSGEGMQAYGWGIYATKRKSIGQYYAKKLQTRSVHYKDYSPSEFSDLIMNSKKYPHLGKGDIENALYDLRYKNKKFAIENRTNEIEYFGYESELVRVSKLKEEVALLETIDIKDIALKKDQIGLYEVDIPESDVMLDWDKPLSQQPKKVKAGITEIVNNLSLQNTTLANRSHGNKDPVVSAVDTINKFKTEFLNGTYADNVGLVFYGHLSYFTGSDKAASLLLNKHGIEGIKYLDGVSRDKGQGTPNFVVFNDKAIKILDREVYYQSAIETAGADLNNPADVTKYVKEIEKNTDDSKVYVVEVGGDKYEYTADRVPIDEDVKRAAENLVTQKIDSLEYEQWEILAGKNSEAKRKLLNEHSDGVEAALQQYNEIHDTNLNESEFLELDLSEFHYDYSNFYDIMGKDLQREAESALLWLKWELTNDRINTLSDVIKQIAKDKGFIYDSMDKSRVSESAYLYFYSKDNKDLFNIRLAQHSDRHTESGRLSVNIHLSNKDIVENVLEFLKDPYGHYVGEDIYYQSGIDDNTQEIMQKAVMPRTAETVSEAQTIALKEANRNPENKRLGIKGNISNNSIRKLRSAKATHKSISTQAHAMAVANVDVLFENALFDVSHKDFKGIDEIANIHTLGSIMLFKGEYLPVKTTVMEIVDRNTKNKVYSIEAVDIERSKLAENKEVRRAIVSAQNKQSAQDEPITPIADFNEKITEILKNVNTAKEKIDEYNQNANQTGGNPPTEANFNRTVPRGMISKTYELIDENNNGLGRFDTESGARQRAADMDLSNCTLKPHIKVELTEYADATTFIHEMGHYFLINMEDFVKAGGKGEIAADYKEVKRFLGYKEGQGAWTQEQHEKWARSVEKYFMEGVSPSYALRRVFRKLSAWMRAIYKRLVFGDVELNAQMRAVMDRMFATQEEIARKNPINNDIFDESIKEFDEAAQEKLKELNETAKDAVMEKVGAQFMKDLSRSNQERWKKWSVQTRKETKEEVALLPVYAAEKYISDMLQIKDLRKFAANYDNTSADEFMVAFDAYSKEFGYQDGTLYAYELINSPLIEDAVEAAYEKKTEEYMAAQAKQNQAEIDRFVKTEQGLELIASEMELLNKRNTMAQAFEKARFAAKLYRQKAKEILSAMPIKQAIRSMPYINSERDLAIASAKAMIEGDKNRAARLKRKQLINHALAMESMKIRKQFDFHNAKLEKAKTRNRKLYKDMEHFAQVADILNRFGYKRNDYMPEMKGESLTKYIERMSFVMDAFVVSDWVQDENNKGYIRDLNINQIIDISQAVDNLIAYANTEDTLFRIARGENIDGLVGEIATELSKTVKDETRNKNKKKRMQRDRDKGIGKKAMEGLDALIIDGKTMDTLAYQADGYKDNGYFYKTFIKPVKQAIDKESQMLAKNCNDYWALINRVFGKEDYYKNNAVIKALDNIASGSEEEIVVNLRDDLGQYGGSNDISFIYGDDKKGLVHIAQRHSVETLGKVIDTVINGKIKRYVKGNDTIHIQKGGYEALLRLQDNNKKKTWLLTGFKIDRTLNKKAAGENGKVSAKSVSTQNLPTFSRQDLVAAAKRNIQNKKVKINKTAKAYLKDFQTKDIMVEEFGNHFTKAELIGLALNLGNTGNRQRLNDNRIADFKGGKDLWNVDFVQTVLGKYLNRQDWEFVQGFWDIISGNKQEAFDMHKEITGFKPNEVQPYPFQIVLANGEKIELNGGYYPLKYDYRVNEWERDKIDAQNPLYTEGSPAWKAHTRQSQYKPRKKEVFSPVVADMNIGIQHIFDIVHDINFRPILLDMNRLLIHPEFANLLRDNLGDKNYRVFKLWVKSFGLPENDTVDEKGINRVINFYRKNVGASNLILKPSIITQNLSNFFILKNVIDGFGLKQVQETVVFAISNAKSLFDGTMRDEVLSKSAMMRDRSEAFDFTIKEGQNPFTGKNSVFVKAGNWAMNFTDNISMLPAWIVAYNQSINDMGLNEKGAIDRADLLIQRVVGTGRKYDASQYTRSRNMIVRLLNPFSTFMMNELNRWWKEAGRAVHQSDYGRFAGFALSRLAVFALAGEIFSGRLPDAPDDEDSWFKFVLSSMGNYAFGMLPYIRVLGVGIVNSFAGMPIYSDRQLSPVFQNMKAGILEPIQNIGALVNKKRKGKKLKKGEMQRFTERMTNSALIDAGAPTYLGTAFWNLYDIFVNDMSPRASDIFRRRPKKERKK
jgi:hypothetical protein